MPELNDAESIGRNADGFGCLRCGRMFCFSGCCRTNEFNILRGLVLQKLFIDKQHKLSHPCPSCSAGNTGVSVNRASLLKQEQLLKLQ